MNQTQKKAILDYSANLIDGHNNDETEGILPYIIDICRVLNYDFVSLNNRDKVFYIDSVDSRLKTIQENWKELQQLLDGILINNE